MKKHSLAALASLAALLPLLHACGKKDNAGFASETTNGVAVRGSTEPGTIITAFHAGATSADSMEATTNADKSGNWELLLAPGGYLILHSQEDVAAAGNIIVRSEDSTAGIEVDLEQEPWTILEGQVPGNALAKISQSTASIREVVLFGLGRRAKLATDGSFLFSKIPQGNYLVRLEVDGKPVAESMLTTGINNELSLADSILVLEDFNDGDNTTNLTKIFGSSFWLNWLNKDSVKVTPALSNNWEIAGFLTDSSAFEGKSLHVALDIDEDFPEDPSLLLVLGSRGVKGEAENVHDLSASDSLVFQAKGNGKPIIDIWARAKDTGKSHHLYYEVLLQAEWTRHAIAWKKMTIDGNEKEAGTQWSNLEVLKVSWKFTADTDFWLDQVEIPDLKISDLLAP